MFMRLRLPLLLIPLAAGAEVRSLTLRQAVELARTRNPDLSLARFDELKAAAAVQVARDPFTPHVYAGSGLAYSSGFPMSIEGAAPSVIQARASMAIYNKQQRLLVDQAMENARGAALSSEAKREEVVFRVASLYLDSERALRAGQIVAQQAGQLEKAADFVRARVEDGRELPLELRKAALSQAQAKRRKERIEADLAHTERMLAILLGFPAEDRVRAVVEERAAAADEPADGAAAAERALQSNAELRRLQSAIDAKALEVRAQRSARTPRVDLVAQYGLFAKFNNYEDFFRTFQRHNGQLGVSVQLPLFVGSAAAGLASQAESDLARLRVELTAARNRVALDARRGFDEIAQAKGASEVARIDLDLAREQLSVTLALIEEGRASLRQVEEARFQENEKWLAFYDAQYAMERAKLNLARQTGELAALLK
jgi:outer membrane protein TolC